MAEAAVSATAVAATAPAEASGGVSGEDAVAGLSADKLGELLRSREAKIGLRMRAVFHLRTLGGEPAVRELGGALKALKGGSSLLRHEIAFVLGQMQLSSANETLSAVLRDLEDCPVVRHEAAEALGAIGDPESLGILEEFCEDARPEVSETCKIAVKRLRWLASEQPAEKTPEDLPFMSVDPAPPPAAPTDVREKAEAEARESTGPQSVEALVGDLLNTDLELFQRYRAMFGLRNRGGAEAVLGLTKGLSDSSALFRHEVAYVLGQMEDPVSVPALKACLQDASEHGMVRHEAAEALGAIGSEECVELLRAFRSDPDPLVSESCETALDSIDYWQAFEAPADSAKEAAPCEG